MCWDTCSYKALSRLRQHTSAYVQHTSACTAYVQNTFGVTYVGTHVGIVVGVVNERMHLARSIHSVFNSFAHLYILQHTSAYDSIRSIHSVCNSFAHLYTLQHTSAYVSIRSIHSVCNSIAHLYIFASYLLAYCPRTYTYVRRM
jgi:hypothetical protein